MQPCWFGCQLCYKPQRPQWEENEAITCLIFLLRVPAPTRSDCPHSPQYPRPGPLLHMSSPLHASRPCPVPSLAHSTMYPRVPAVPTCPMPFPVHPQASLHTPWPLSTPSHPSSLSMPCDTSRPCFTTQAMPFHASWPCLALALVHMCHAAHVHVLVPHPARVLHAHAFAHACRSSLECLHAPAPPSLVFPTEVHHCPTWRTRPFPTCLSSTYTCAHIHVACNASSPFRW